MTIDNSYHAIRQELLSQKTSCTQIVHHFLNSTSQNQDLNAFIEVFNDEALDKAAKVDEKIRKGTAGSLAGLVVAIKDNLLYKNHRAGASGNILNHFTAQYSATVIERLIQEDAIIIGITNCDEFAMGSSNEYSAFGPVRNPFDRSRVPGGSSGGAAVAVAAGMCHVSLGSDTGGSVRQPAAHCGVIGLKPTYGRVSRHGLISFASSFDTIGILANSIADCEAVLQVVEGQDDHDAHTNHVVRIRDSSDALRIGFIRLKNFSHVVSVEIAENFHQAIGQIMARGFQTSSIDLPLVDVALPCYHLLSMAEASSNLARYDGWRYGSSSLNSEMNVGLKEVRSTQLGREVKRRLILGNFCLSAAYYDSYYIKAMKVRTLITEKILQLLQTCDLILLPVTGDVAFGLGEKMKDPLKMYQSDLFTIPASLSGLPAISIPYLTSEKGLPIGLQIISNYFQEEKILKFAKQILNRTTL